MNDKPVSAHINVESFTDEEDRLSVSVVLTNADPACTIFARAVISLAEANTLGAAFTKSGSASLAMEINSVIMMQTNPENRGAVLAIDSPNLAFDESVCVQLSTEEGGLLSSMLVDCAKDDQLLYNATMFTLSPAKVHKLQTNQKLLTA